MEGKKAGIILGLFSMLFQNLASFFLTPLMITVFGDGKFGVYKLVLSITAYFALADLGISNSVVKYVSEYKAQKDKNTESRFVSLILLVDVFVGIFIFAVSFIFYYSIPPFFSKSLSADEVRLLQSLFFLLVFNGIFNLFSNLTNGIIKSYEKFGLLKIINICKTAVRTAVTVFLLLNGFSVFSVVLLDMIISFLIFLWTWIYCRVSLKIKLADIRTLEFSYLKKIFSYSLIVFVDAVAFYLFWSADNIIIGYFMSSSAIAVYSIGTLISSLFFSFSLITSDVLMPEIVSKVVSNTSNEMMTEHMIKIGRIKLAILGLPVIGFIFLGKEFITLWVGPNYTDAYYIALIVIIPSMFAGICDVGLYVMWAKNKHKIKSLVSIAISLLNIVLTIVLVKKIGIIGAAAGTAFAYIAGYDIFNSIYFHKVLGLNMFKFFKDTFHKLWIPIFITSVASFLISCVAADSWLTLILLSAFITSVYLILLFSTGINRRELEMIKRIFYKN